MTTRAEILAIIDGEVNQGTRLTSALPTYLRRAFIFMERNYNFLHMERFAEIQLDLSAENPRFLAFPSNRAKSVKFIRYRQANPTGSDQYNLIYLNSVDPITINTIEPASKPSAYWLTGSEEGQVYAVLDQVGTENIDFETHYLEFSTFPATATAEHWLFTYAEDALVAKTMQMLAPYANEPDWIEAYQQQWDEGIRTLTLADEEARHSGPADGFKMVYR